MHFNRLTTSRNAVDLAPDQAVGGRTVADLRAVVDAETAAVSGTPEVILFNLGANDIHPANGWPVDENTWKTNLLYCWDAYNAAWNSAELYAMRVWRRTYGANADILNGWLDDCIALRAFAHVGPDERVYLENGDDGAAYTSDGTHPNAAGYELTAGQWQNTLGVA